MIAKAFNHEAHSPAEQESAGLWLTISDNWRHPARIAEMMKGEVQYGITQRIRTV